jgi:hypothetical protein
LTDESDPPGRAQISRILAVVALTGAALVFGVSLVQGPPETIPVIALGWPLLLYLERAALVAGIVMGIGGTADRLLRGDAVQGFSAPGGPGVQIAEHAADADEALKDALDETVKELDERLSRLESKE